MYCGQCGTEVRDGAQFCPCCGGIMEDTSERDESGVYTGRSTRARKKRRIWPWVLLILVVLIAAGAAIGFFWYLQASVQSDEDAFVTGKESYTALITAYLEEASANDTEDLLDLFFPNSEEYYQNADGTKTTLEILRCQDNWSAYYGCRAVSAELEDAVFADLTGTNTAAVVSVIRSYGNLEEISEIYTVNATVTYQDGTMVEMLFEIVQCEYGCYLVAVTTV